VIAIKEIFEEELPKEKILAVRAEESWIRFNFLSR